MYSYQDIYDQNGQQDPTQIPPPITGAQWATGTPQANGVQPQFIPSGAPYAPVQNAAGQTWAASGPSGNLDTNGNPMSFGSPPTATTPTPAAAADLQSGILAAYTATPPAFQTYQPFTPSTFTPPTIADALQDPGYQFSVQQGEDSLQNWAAARGTLNDSGTAKALIDYGQNAAQQAYGDVYSRDFNTWQANNTAQAAAYGLNRQTQSIDPWTAAYNIWAQQGQNYLQNQGTAANTSLGFAQIA